MIGPGETGARTPESPLAIYRAHLAQGRLAFQWSPTAERAVFYPRLVCPFSGSDLLEWRMAAGGGMVYATTVVHTRGSLPHNVALVDCDEGFRLMTRVTGVSPDAVSVGMRVQLVIRPLEGSAEPLPLFVPAQPA